MLRKMWPVYERVLDNRSRRLFTTRARFGVNSRDSAADPDTGTASFGNTRWHSAAVRRSARATGARLTRGWADPPTRAFTARRLQRLEGDLTAIYPRRIRSASGPPRAPRS